MNAFFEDQSTLWLTIGFVLLAIEAVAFGFGSGLLLFGSLGAIATGALLWFGVVPDNFIAAVACFAVSTGLLTAVLWQPLRRMQSGAELGHDRSSDLIGNSFIIATEVTPQQAGIHKFSGVNWRVEPAPELGDITLPPGTRVRVSAVSAGIFYVEPETRDPK